MRVDWDIMEHTERNRHIDIGRGMRVDRDITEETDRKRNTDNGRDR